MAKIPTTYNTGLATAAQLRPVAAVNVPSDYEQQIPQALMNFGKQLEKASYELENLEQRTEYQKNVSDFKVQLADANELLVKRKESLANDASIPEADKATRFSEYAKAVQDDLFSAAPKHIVMDYKANFMNTVLPMQMQVQNNAQSAMKIQSAQAILLARDEAESAIKSIALSGGSVDDRRKLFGEYMQQTTDKLNKGIGSVGSAARAELEGHIQTMQAKAVEIFDTAMLKETKDQVESALNNTIVQFKNSPTAMQNPGQSVEALYQIIDAHGKSAGWDYNKITQEKNKAANEIWVSSTSVKVSEADMQKTFGAKIAADTALVKQLLAVDPKTGQFSYGGSQLDADKRNQFVATLTNRIQSNREKQLAEARRNDGSAVGIGAALDPLVSAARLNGEKVVRIDLRDPASLKARAAQAVRLGVPNYVITREEANSIASQLLTLPNSNEMIKTVSTVTSGMNAGMRGTFINTIAGQLKNVKPEVATTLSLVANNNLTAASTYFDTYNAVKNSNDPALKKTVKQNYEKTVKSLSGSGLPQDMINMYADIIGVLSANNKQFDYKKTFSELVGTNTKFNNWNMNPTHNMFVPAGHNVDKLVNWMNSPNSSDVQKLGTTSYKVINNKPVLSRGQGGYVIELRDNKGDFVMREDGTGPVIIPLTGWFGDK